MERVPSDVERFYLGVTDLNAFLVDPRVDGTFNLEPGLGRGCRDEVDDRGAIRERTAPPGLRDATEEAVFDLVPFRGSWRKVSDLDGEARLVRQLLQIGLPLIVERVLSCPVERTRGPCSAM